MKWIQERAARWDDDKTRILGAEPQGVFPPGFADHEPNAKLPGMWWRVEKGDQTVGYGWLDVVWGDAEILLATAAEERGKGVGDFVLNHLAKEAQSRGLNYLYNVVQSDHPRQAETTAWLEKRGFKAREDGQLRRPTAHGS